MTRRRWLQAALTLILLWMLGVVWIGRGLEGRLDAVAAQAVQELDASSEGQRFAAVAVDFSGQRAHLSGEVRSESDARRIARLVRDELRLTPEARLNPVTKLVVDEALKIKPRPPGWLVVAVAGPEVAVRGVCSTEVERAVLEELLRARWSLPGAKLSLSLQTDPRRYEDAQDLGRTVASLPIPTRRGPEAVSLAAGRLGEVMEELDVNAADTAIRGLPVLKEVDARTWRDFLQPQLQHLRVVRTEELAWQTEQERLAALPPAHVVAGLRGDQMLVRGEVGDKADHRDLLARLMAAFPGVRVLDDVRVTGQRRPQGRFGSMPAEMQAADEGSYQVVAGEDWRAGSEAESGEAREAEVREGLKLDGAVVANWVRGENAGIPRLAPEPRRPFFTLALYAGRAVLGGEVADEAERSLMLEAVKRAYPADWVVVDEVVVSGACGPMRNLEHALRSLPEPPQEMPPVLLAVTGGTGSWGTAPSAKVIWRTEALGEAEAPWLPPGVAVGRVALAWQLPMEEIRALGLVARPKGGSDQ
ncbi:MAG: BON domain-containing protein [Verrucomicrobiales bacterium]|nr:BON domain-containing protein [Verrucomicrobiales bacterium]